MLFSLRLLMIPAGRDHLSCPHTPAPIPKIDSARGIDNISSEWVSTFENVVVIL